MILIPVVVLLATMMPPFPPRPVFQVNLISDHGGASVAPGSQIDWRIEVVQVAGPECLGLAGISCDLVQAVGNPSSLDISPGNVPVVMANFSRPAGISNPQPGNVNVSAYGGTQIGSTGALNLVQIGGMQNTFGIPGMNIGTATSVVTGLGTAATPLLVTQGTLTAPDHPGYYAISLGSVMTTYLAIVNAAPASSTACFARTSVGDSLAFTVCCLADFNCSGGTPDDTDTADFFQAWNNGDESADVNHSGGTPDDTDIAVFFSHWNGGC